MLISFSGLDGAGKSTLIAWLCTELERRQRPVAVLHMNDDVGLYAWARALRDLVWGARPADEPPRMAPRSSRLGRVRDAIVWSKTLRRLLYPLDLLVFLVRRFYHEVLRRQVLIMDRYFYDRLVDVADGAIEPTGWSQTWLRILAGVTPAPDLPILLEIDPEAAFARKREYTIPYLRTREAAYRLVFPWVPGAVRIASDQLETARRSITQAVQERLHP